MKATLAVIILAVAGWFAYQYFQARPQKHLAPPGVFYLTQRTSYVGSDGIIGYAPGSEVRLVSENGAEATVTREGHDLTVPKNHLTNDLDVAAALKARDAQTQARVAAGLARSREEVERRQAEQAAAVERDNRARAAAENARRATRSSSALNRGAFNQQEGVARAPVIIYRPTPIPKP